MHVEPLNSLYAFEEVQKSESNTIYGMLYIYMLNRFQISQFVKWKSIFFLKFHIKKTLKYTVEVVVVPLSLQWTINNFMITISLPSNKLNWMAYTILAMQLYTPMWQFYWLTKKNGVLGKLKVWRPYPTITSLLKCIK